MNGGDVVEHWLVRQPAPVHWSLSVLACAGVIVLMGGPSAAGPQALLVAYLLFLIADFAVNRVIEAAGRSSALSTT